MDIILPASIEIGGITYRILTDAATIEELRYEGNAGQHDARQQEIRLCSDKRITPDRLRKTVLHEFVHAVSYEYDREHEVTESQTDALCQGLAQIFKQLGITFKPMEQTP